MTTERPPVTPEGESNPRKDAVADLAYRTAVQTMLMGLADGELMGPLMAEYVEGLHIGAAFALGHPNEARRFVNEINHQAKGMTGDEQTEHDQKTIGVLVEAYAELSPEEVVQTIADGLDEQDRLAKERRFQDEATAES